MGNRILMVCLLALGCLGLAGDTGAAVFMTPVKPPSGSVSLSAVAWHPDQNLALTVGYGGSSGNARVYLYRDAPGGQEIGRLIPRTDAPAGSYYGVAWDAAGRFAVLAGWDKRLVRYDMATDRFSNINMTLTQYDVDFTAATRNPVNGWIYLASNTVTASGSNYQWPNVYRTDGVVVEGPLAVSNYFAQNQRYYINHISWRPDGDYMLLASSFGVLGMFVFDPDQNSFPPASGPTMQFYQTPQANYYSVAFRPKPFNTTGEPDYFALAGLSSSVYRYDDAGLNTANGGLNTTEKSGFSSGIGGPYYSPSTIAWHSNGDAALVAGSASTTLRMGPDGTYTDSIPNPAPTASIQDAAWRPNTNMGLMVGAQSYIVKWVDSGTINGTQTPIPTATLTPTPSLTPTLTLTPSLTPTFSLTPTPAPTVPTPTLTATNTPTTLPTVTRSPTPSPTGSPTPGLTPTFSLTPSPTVSPTLTPTPPVSPTVIPGPMLFLSGYGTTNLVTEAGSGALYLLGFVDPVRHGDTRRVQVYYQGTDAGVELYDDGVSGDGNRGDGLYGRILTLRDLGPAQVTLELRAYGANSQVGEPWPYLNVRP